MSFTISVDGSNLSRLQGRASLPILMEARDQVLADASDSGARVRVFVDAAFRHQIEKKDLVLLEELVRSGKVEIAPASMSADRLVVEAAAEGEGIVISNDRFTELCPLYEWLEENGAKRFFGAVRDGHTGKWKFIEKNHGAKAPAFLSEHLRSYQKSSINSSIAPSLLSAKPASGRYGWPISRAHPGLMVLLLDQSASMSKKWKGGTRAEKVADVLNESIYELIMLSLRSAADGSAEVRPYFDVAVIGYGAEVKSLLPGTSISEPLVSVVDLAEMPRLETIRREDGTAEEKTVWLDPRAEGQTPMIEAIAKATAIVDDWAEKHRNSHPAIVFNITDGAQTDGSADQLRSAITKLKGTRTVDRTLFFNGHISGLGEGGVFCPRAAPNGDNARLMFEVASALPHSMVSEALRRGFSQVGSESKGYVYNGSPEQIATLIKVGTPGTPPLGVN